MSDAQDGLIERLRERADSYRQCGPSAEHSAALYDDAADMLAAQAGEIADLKATLAAEVKTSSHLAKAIEELRAELAAARKEIDRLRSPEIDITGLSQGML